MRKRLSLYWFTKIISYLLAVVLLLLVLLLTLLSTETGSRFTMRQASAWAHEWVKFESFEGVLLRDFSMQQLTIFLPEHHQIEIDQLHFRWRPWQLLQHQFHIRTLELHNIQITLSESQKEPAPSQWPLVLPNIKTNWQLRFDRFLLEQLHVVTRTQNISKNEQVPPFIATSLIQIPWLQARGRFEQNQFYLHDLQLEANKEEMQLKAQLKGQLTPSGYYPLMVQAQLQSQLPDIGAIVTELQLSGNLQQKLTLSAQTKGVIVAHLQSQLTQLLSGAPEWQVQTNVQEISHQSLTPYISNLTVALDAQGGLNQGEGRLLVAGVSPDYGSVQLEFEANLNEQEIQLKQLFLQANDYGLSSQITGTVQGTPAALQIALTGQTQWQEFPLVTTKINYQGSTEAAEQLLLDFTTELGSLTAIGSARWVDDPEWDFVMTSHALQLDRFPLPSALQPYLNGSQLNSHLHLQGKWGQNKHWLKAYLSELNTDIDQQAFSLTGTFQLDNEDLLLEGLQLTLGEGLLQGQGQGKLNRFALELIGENLTFDQFSLATFKSQLLLDTSLEKLPTGTISLHELTQTEGFAPTNISITLKHTELYHAEVAVATTTQHSSYGTDITAQLKLSGRWLNQEWQGTLEQLAFDYPEIGAWSLEQVTPFQFDATTALVTPFCLSAHLYEAKICAQLDWAKAEQKLVAATQLQNITFKLFEPWLPNTFTAQGLFDFNAEYNQTGDKRSYQANAYLHETQLHLIDQDLQLQLHAGTIFTLSGDEKALQGQLNFATEELGGGLTGAFSLASPFAEPTLQAELQINFTDLNIISLLSPELQNVQGHLTGAFAFSGAATQPFISGKLELLQARAEVPSAGLTLEQLNLHITSPKDVGGPFLLAGQVRSGDGELRLEGEYDLTSHKTLVNIVGENFTAMNSREIQLRVSPDTQVQLGPNLLQVRGNIHVPSALITPPDFTVVDASSKDTIIVRGEETLWQNSSQSIADIDLQMSLGDSVQVIAYGFEGHLSGHLRLIEKPNQDTTGIGNINVVSGRYELYGQALNIERGTLVFSGGTVSNPGLDLRVSRTVDTDKVTVGARVGGSLQEPNLALFSTPTMQDAEILSYLIFGRGFGDEIGEDQNMLLQASLALGMQGGNLIGERLSESLGVDEIMLDAGDTLESASLYIGKHLSSRLYVRYGIGLVEPVNTFFIRYRLTDFLNFETQTGTLGSGADLFYSIEH